MYIIKSITGIELVNVHGSEVVSDPNAASVAELSDSTLNTMPYLKPILSKLTELAQSFPAITHLVLNFKHMTQDQWHKNKYAKLATNSATTVTVMLKEWWEKIAKPGLEKLATEIDRLAGPHTRFECMNGGCRACRRPILARQTNQATGDTASNGSPSGPTSLQRRPSVPLGDNGNIKGESEEEFLCAAKTLLCSCDDDTFGPFQSASSPSKTPPTDGNPPLANAPRRSSTGRHAGAPLANRPSS